MANPPQLSDGPIKDGILWCQNRKETKVDTISLLCGAMCQTMTSILALSKLLQWFWMRFSLNVNIGNPSNVPKTALISDEITLLMEKQLQIWSRQRSVYPEIKNGLHKYIISEVEYFHLHFFPIFFHIYLCFSFLMVF